MWKKLLCMLCFMSFPLAGGMAATCTDAQIVVGDECVDAKFTIKTIEFSGGETFNFEMSAYGTFYVDWGDGTVDVIARSNVNSMTYSHTYSEPGTYNIRFAGVATRYNTSANVYTIMFRYNNYIAGISGSLGAIFPTIGDGVASGTQPRFRYLFQDNINLTGTIPAELFKGIHGQPVSWQFANIFHGCSNLLGPIPAGMFADMSGVPAIGMYSHMFEGARKLMGEIPADMFGDISGPAKTFMYAETFRYCDSLTGDIPDGLFGNITGSPQQAMYRNTFQGCSGLTGEIPGGLFGDFTGAPASEMFISTFDGCSGLTGFVPENLFSNISTSGATADMFSNMFTNSGLPTSCPGGTTQVVNRFESFISGRVSCVLNPVFRITLDNTGMQTAGAPTDVYLRYGGDWYRDEDTESKITVLDRLPATGTDGDVFRGYFSEPGGLGVQIINDAGMFSTGLAALEFTNSDAIIYPFFSKDKFIVTTTYLSAGTTFSFTMQAAGNFTVNWGDGTIEQIERPNTNVATYSHTYDNAGAYQIGFGGMATGYPGVAAVLAFTGNPYVAGISGSLGAIFPTLGTSQPSFKEAFKDCVNLTSTIPSTLFDGVSGTIAESQFRGVFQGCVNLAGPIPADLFKGPFVSVGKQFGFGHLFNGCENLSGEIPAGLFANVSGPVGHYMFTHLFYNNARLTGSIPADLFANITGPSSSYGQRAFRDTFTGCSGLTGSIPGGLFRGITTTIQPGIFTRTFANCPGLTGPIPEELFSNVTGIPTQDLFRQTFDGDSGLTGYVPANLFSGLTPGATATEMMTGVFSGTGLETECPSCRTEQYLTGYESWFDGRVSCIPTGNDTFDGDCVEYCPYGFTKLKTKTGLEFPIFSEKMTTPSINVKLDDGICFVPLRSGNGGRRSLNFKYQDKIWHAGTVDE